VNTLDPPPTRRLTRRWVLTTRAATAATLWPRSLRRRRRCLCRLSRSTLRLVTTPLLMAMLSRAVTVSSTYRQRTLPRRLVSAPALLPGSANKHLLCFCKKIFLQNYFILRYLFKHACRRTYASRFCGSCTGHRQGTRRECRQAHKG